MLAAYKVATGERIYQERLGGTGGSFSASPVAADGKLYLTSEDGDIFVVKAGPTYEMLAKNSMGEVRDGDARRIRRHHLRARPEEPVRGRRAKAIGDPPATKYKARAPPE